VLASAPVYLDSDDAKTDVILAGAAAALGGAARGIVAQLPGYPRVGLAAVVIDLVWAFAVTGLVPLLLARHRGDRGRAFGLHRPSRGLGLGLALGVPVIGAELALGLAIGVSPARVLIGRLAATGVVLGLVQVAVLAGGSLLLITFLASRGAALSRSEPRPLVGLVRTIGLGSAAVALLAGAARSLAGPALLPVILSAAALAAVVLVADRRIATVTLPRATVLAPAIVVAVVHVIATGGPLRGDLVTALYAGGLAVGIATVVAALGRGETTRWAAVPLLVAVHWWPSCLSPLALEIARAC
jgi:hypothetical protein